MMDSPALGWGIHIDRVEIKDVLLPDSMKRSFPVELLRFLERSTPTDPERAQ